MRHFIGNRTARKDKNRIFVPIYEKKFLCHNCHKIFMEENLGAEVFYHFINGKWRIVNRIDGHYFTYLVANGEGGYTGKKVYQCVRCPNCGSVEKIEGKIDEFTPLNKYGRIKLFNKKILKLKTT